MLGVVSGGSYPKFPEIGSLAALALLTWLVLIENPNFTIYNVVLNFKHDTKI